MDANNNDHAVCRYRWRLRPPYGRITVLTALAVGIIALGVLLIS